MNRGRSDGAGRLIKVETGSLVACQSEAVAPAGWSGFTIHYPIVLRVLSLDPPRELATARALSPSNAQRHGRDVAAAR